MDLDQLRIFVAVSKRGSFRAVAQDLRVAPSSISRAISGLEEQLKTRLLQRSTRKQTLTQAGENLVQRLTPILEELDGIESEFQDKERGPSGRLRVSVSTSLGHSILLPAIPGFCRDYPDVELDLVMSDSRVDLLEQRIDLAIRHGQLNDSTLIARKLCPVRYKLVASPAYFQQKDVPTSPLHLSTHDLLSFSYQDFRHVWCFEHPKKEAQEISVSPRLTANTALALRALAQAGAGIAVLADWCVRDDLEQGALVELLAPWRLGGKLVGKHLWSIRPSRAFVPKKTRAFEQMLLDLFASPVI